MILLFHFLQQRVTAAVSPLSWRQGHVCCAWGGRQTTGSNPKSAQMEECLGGGGGFAGLPASKQAGCWALAIWTLQNGQVLEERTRGCPGDSPQL